MICIHAILRHILDACVSLRARQFRKKRVRESKKGEAKFQEIPYVYGTGSGRLYISNNLRMRTAGQHSIIWRRIV